MQKGEDRMLKLDASLDRNVPRQQESVPDRSNRSAKWQKADFLLSEATKRPLESGKKRVADTPQSEKLYVSDIGGDFVLTGKVGFLESSQEPHLPG
jgi:hypothetical protein